MSGYWTLRRVAMLGKVRPSWAAGAGLWRDFRRSAAGVTDTHAQTINADDAAGAYSAFAPNALVRTNRGLQTSPTRTNEIRNNSMQGAVAGAIGSGGALPTNWLRVGDSGMTLTVVGTGTASNGMPYIDLRFAGTTNNTFANIETDASNVVAALTGEVWTLSAFLELRAGSLSGVTTRLNVPEYTSTTTFIRNNSQTLTAPGATLARQSKTVTLSGGGTTAFIKGILVFEFANGATLDFTLRFAAPQLEEAAFASPPILTTSAAVTINGNQQVIAGIPAPTTEAGLAVINLRGSADTNVLWSRNDGTANEWIGLIRDGANLDFRVIDGGGTVADLNLGTMPVGRFGFAYTVGAGYARAQIVSGATVAPLAPATFPTVTQWAAGDGYSAARNAFINTERMALAAGVTANDATFAAWLARAVLALAA